MAATDDSAPPVLDDEQIGETGSADSDDDDEATLTCDRSLRSAVYMVCAQACYVWRLRCCCTAVLTERAVVVSLVMDASTVLYSTDGPPGNQTIPRLACQPRGMCHVSCAWAFALNCGTFPWLD